MSENTKEGENSQNLKVVNTEDAEKDVEVAEVIPGFASFDDYVKSAFAAMRSGVKAANSLPNGENFNYYACFPKFNEVRNRELKRILTIMQGVVELSGAAGSVKNSDIEEKFELLLEANDIFLDRAGACMDEEEGVSKKPGVSLIVSQTNKKNVFGSWNATTSTPSESQTAIASSLSSIRLLAARNVQRPQLTFSDKIDNSSKPWQPRIKDKPNSLKPLALYTLVTENGEVFSHPYETELDKFEPRERELVKAEPIPYKSLDDTPLIVIEKAEDLKILLEDLKQYNEIAIDLEHHSYRTFQGITCLMQISTRDTDYLIDTLTLRSNLHVLNEIFTKPSVLKVFHGADSDILWLQRDLSLYIVNMFDTHQAAKQLDLPYLSLGFLMKRYCNLDPNKHFQLADWRIRPLPEELMKYAREDTHYLLYIKDILRNGLIDAANRQSNILKVVYDRSTDLCKRVYEKPVWTEESYLNMYRKSHKMFNNRQIYALKELHSWRDATARQEDDSTGYVLPNHMLLNIAETLPREMQGILACCNPIPPLVRQNLLRLHKIILKAREQPLVKPVLEQDIRQRLTQRNQAINTDVWIHTPHDIPSGMEVRSNLPCLLNSEQPEVNLSKDEQYRHSVTVFDSPAESEDEEAVERQKRLKKKKTLFVSPFERYKRVIPMVAAHEAEERERQEKIEAERVRVAVKNELATARSIDRVHDHFQNVVQNANISPEPRVPKTPIPLGQMHGRKRKRQSDVNDTEEYRNDSQNFTRKRRNESPDSKPAKQMKREATASHQHKKTKPIKLPVVEPATREQNPVKNLNAFAASEQKRKTQKQANINELRQRGMLPQKNFDYKSVDFSSFQGGSKVNDASRSTQFQQHKQKDKIKKGKKRKKQKINGI